MVLQIENAGNIKQFQPVAGTIQATLVDKMEGEKSLHRVSPGSQSRSKSSHTDPTKIADKRTYQAYLFSIGRVPLLMVVAREDATTPVDIPLAAYQRFRESKQLVTLLGWQFEVYSGPKFALSSPKAKSRLSSCRETSCD